MAQKLIDLLKGLDDGVRVHDGLTTCEPWCLVHALTDAGFQDEARYCLESHRIVRLDDPECRESLVVYTLDRYPDAKDVQKSVFDLLEAMSGEERKGYAQLLPATPFGSCESIREFMENHAEDGEDAGTVAKRYVKARFVEPASASAGPRPGPFQSLREPVRNQLYERPRYRNSP
jgi:hypothetical protein